MQLPSTPHDSDSRQHRVGHGKVYSGGSGLPRAAGSCGVQVDNIRTVQSPGGRPETRPLPAALQCQNANWQRCGRPLDRFYCSRRAGLQQCKSFVEMCIVNCLSALTVSVCGRGTAGAALVVVRLAVVTLPPRSTTPAVAGCCLDGCNVVSGLPLCSRAVAGV